jgi:hypothetical protein
MNTVANIHPVERFLHALTLLRSDTACTSSSRRGCQFPGLVAVRLGLDALPVRAWLLKGIIPVKTYTKHEMGVIRKI